jgi:sialidase-1
LLSRRTLALFLAALALAPSHSAADAPAEPVRTALYTSGKEGFGRVRIPALIVSQKGTVLAFCEGRHKPSGLTGDIDLVLKRSTDDGRSWQPLQIVADDGPNTLGNPCPVIDQTTGTIWLPFTRSLGPDTESQITEGTSKGTTKVWLTKSSDDGATWAKPIDISETTKLANWTWYGTGPGIGLQMPSGRLVIPSYHAEAGTQMYKSHMIFSDDHGASWRLGNSIGDYTAECQVALLSNDTLMLNARTIEGGGEFRSIATSSDGGSTWTKPTLDAHLSEPHCQGCVYVLTDGKDGHKRRMLFLNPPGPGPHRREITLRLSYDEGKTWPIAKKLDQGPSAYSCLALLPDGTIGCLYERGETRSDQEISFAKFTLEWLTDGKDSLAAQVEK